MEEQQGRFIYLLINGAIDGCGVVPHAVVISIWPRSRSWTHTGMVKWDLSALSAVGDGASPNGPQSIIPARLRARRPCFKADLLVTLLQTHHPLYSEATSARSPSITITPISPFIHPTCVCLALVSAPTLLH